MAFESASRRVEKLKNPAPSAPEEAPEAEDRMDFDQTIHDPRRGKSFALYIDSSKTKDRLVQALAKYKKGDAEARDITALQRAFEAFEGREASAEHSFKTIENWESDILKNSATLKRFTRFKNFDLIKRVFEKGLPDLALKDPKLFKEIQSEIGKLNGFVERDDKATKVIAQFCADQGIAEDGEVLDALTHGTERERNAAVQELLRRHLRQRDGWRSFFAGKYIKTVAADLSRVNLTGFNDERKQVSKEFGDYLHAFLLKNKEFRSALTRAHDERQPAFKEGSETKLSFAEAQAENGELTKEASLKRAKAYREANKGAFQRAKALMSSRVATDVAAGTKQLNDLQDDFLGSEEHRGLKYEREGGAFARVFVAILGALFDVKADPDIKKELS